MIATYDNVAFDSHHSLDSTMRLRLLISLCFGLALIALVVFLKPVSAGIRPSFSLEYCSWHATDIVLAEVAPGVDAFSVIESWKGQLQPGDVIVIPDLHPVPNAVPISLYPRRTDFFAPDPSGISEQIPAQPFGSRSILFLEKEQGSEPSITPAKPGSRARWRSADLFQEMKTSVIWMDGEQLYTFQQVMNPGPSILMPWDVAFHKMKDRVREIGRVQSEMAKVISTQNSLARAEGLKSYVGSELYEAQQLALSELGKCGPSASKTIREMLDNPAFADEAGELVKAFADAGGESAGDELNNRLKGDLAFWQATAPGLSQGWWNHDPRPHAPLREKYVQTVELIRALDRAHYKPALATATQLGNLWRSLPQLNDLGGLNQMAEECETLAAHLQAD
jgi:hypothetical protein